MHRGTDNGKPATAARRSTSPSVTTKNDTAAKKPTNTLSTLVLANEVSKLEEITAKLTERKTSGEAKVEEIAWLQSEMDNQMAVVETLVANISKRSTPRKDRSGAGSVVRVSPAKGKEAPQLLPAPSIYVTKKEKSPAPERSKHHRDASSAKSDENLSSDRHHNAKAVTATNREAESPDAPHPDPEEGTNDSRRPMRSASSPSTFVTRRLGTLEPSPTRKREKATDTASHENQEGKAVVHEASRLNKDDASNSENAPARVTESAPAQQLGAFPRERGQQGERLQQREQRAEGSPARTTQSHVTSSEYAKTELYSTPTRSLSASPPRSAEGRSITKTLVSAGAIRFGTPRTGTPSAFKFRTDERAAARAAALVTADKKGVEGGGWPRSRSEGDERSKGRASTPQFSRLQDLYQKRFNNDNNMDREATREDDAVGGDRRKQGLSQADIQKPLRATEDDESAKADGGEVPTTSARPFKVFTVNIGDVLAAERFSAVATGTDASPERTITKGKEKDGGQDDVDEIKRGTQSKLESSPSADPVLSLLEDAAEYQSLLENLYGRLALATRRSGHTNAIRTDLRASCDEVEGHVLEELSRIAAVIGGITGDEAHLATASSFPLPPRMAKRSQATETDGDGSPHILTRSVGVTCAPPPTIDHITQTNVSMLSHVNSSMQTDRTHVLSRTSQTQLSDIPEWSRPKEQSTQTDAGDDISKGYAYAIERDADAVARTAHVLALHAEAQLYAKDLEAFAQRFETLVGVSATGSPTSSVARERFVSRGVGADGATSEGEGDLLLAIRGVLRRELVRAERLLDSTCDGIARRALGSGLPRSQSSRAVAVVDY